MRSSSFFALFVVLCLSMMASTQVTQDAPAQAYNSVDDSFLADLDVILTDTCSGACRPGALCASGCKCDVPTWTCNSPSDLDVLLADTCSGACRPGALCASGCKCDVPTWTCNSPSDLDVILADTCSGACRPGALCASGCKCDVPTWTCNSPSD